MIEFPRYTVRPVEHAEAQRFVMRYCVKWGLPFDPVRFASASWWGSYLGEQDRPDAVMGLDLMPNKSIFVEGFYSEENRQGKRALRRLLEFMDSIKAPLFATILYKNKDMIDFTLDHLNKRHRQWETAALIINSPFEEQA